MLVGSPEWFKEEAKSDYNIWLNEMIENRRAQFINWFSPDKLAAMDNKTLLMRVFSPSETSMMRMLMYDDDCRWFGAAGKYAYTACVYYDQSMRTWKYKQGQRPEIINQAEAEEKAAYIRERLLYCIKCIQDIGVFHSIADYKRLLKMMSSVFFYEYAWALKYYQMMFPEFFPCMYADHTLSRALQILGLTDHGNKFLNAAEISLFIRRCDINCIVFGSIYGTKWGWEKDCPACEAAEQNLRGSYYPVKSLNLSVYKTPQSQGIEYNATIIKPQVSEKKTLPSVNDNKKTKVNDLSVIPVGCRIKHITLGEGTIISNEKGRLKVSFKKHGIKVLDANFVVKANQIEKI